jgi:sugar lactone lactonase YvrE
MKTILVTLGCVIFSVRLTAADPVSFRTLLEVVKDGDGLAISFTLAASTDVEVAVLDSRGSIVRHLAAGVLGGKSPPPAPLKASLEQKLAWDGKDDFGKKAAGGPYKFRVRAGSGVKFGRFIGDDPYSFGRIDSLAVDEDGRLYISAYEGGLNQNMDTLRVFEPDGTYRRTLIPFPADLKPERIDAVAAWNDKRQAFFPKNTRSQMPEFYPWGAKVQIVSASTPNGIVLTHGTDVFRMDIDGGNVRGPFPMWSKATKLENPAWNVPQLAVSADGRFIYYSNVAGTKYKPKDVNDFNPNWPQGRIYRQDTQKKGDPEKFFDLTLPDWEKSKYWLPDAWNKRTAAYGITLDARGHLHVCDLVNQEIVEVDPDGKKVGATKAPWPERIHVEPKTGDYYAICRLDKPKDGVVLKELLKISGRGDKAKIVARLPLKERGLGDASALGRIEGQPVLWVAGGGTLLCVKDKGESLEVMPSGFNPQPRGQQDWNRIAVDSERDEVYTSDGGSLLFRYDGKTGKGGPLMRDGKPFQGVDLAVGYDGYLYIRTGPSFAGPLERFDRDLKPVPFGSGTHVLSPYIYSRYGVGNCEKGLGVGPNGETYINFMYGWNKYFIAGFGSDGKPIAGDYLKGKIPTKEGKVEQAKGLDSAVIGPIPASCGGIRVDLAGNIYLGLRLWPKDSKLPEELAKNQAYATWTGSIVKFGPKGGTVIGAVKEDDPPNKQKGLDTEQRMTVTGALAIYPGIAPFSGGGYGGGGSACVCRVPRFDLDRFGRIVYTNAVTGSVAVIDNAGNLIVDFGAYGNFDSQYVPAGTKDKKPLVATPAIPLAWPTGAGFGKDCMYVNDTYNRRVVRVEWSWGIEETAEPK